MPFFSASKSILHQSKWLFISHSFVLFFLSRLTLFTECRGSFSSSARRNVNKFNNWLCFPYTLYVYLIARIAQWYQHAFVARVVLGSNPGIENEWICLWIFLIWPHRQGPEIFKINRKICRSTSLRVIWECCSLQMQSVPSQWCKRRHVRSFDYISNE